MRPLGLVAAAVAGLGAGALGFFLAGGFDVHRPPAAPVDGAPVAEDPAEINGWTYVVEDNGVYFWGDAIPPRDSEVVIHYWTTVQ